MFRNGGETSPCRGDAADVCRDDVGATRPPPTGSSWRRAEAQRRRPAYCTRRMAPVAAGCALTARRIRIDPWAQWRHRQDHRRAWSFLLLGLDIVTRTTDDATGSPRCGPGDASELPYFDHPAVAAIALVGRELTSVGAWLCRRSGRPSLPSRPARTFDEPRRLFFITQWRHRGEARRDVMNLHRCARWWMRSSAMRRTLACACSTIPAFPGRRDARQHSDAALAPDADPSDARRKPLAMPRAMRLSAAFAAGAAIRRVCSCPAHRCRTAPASPDLVAARDEPFTLQQLVEPGCG